MAPDGTGLGLPIARWIADSQGGELGLQSAQGQETGVTIRLPLLRRLFHPLRNFQFGLL